MVKCHMCGKGALEEKKVPYALYGIPVGIFLGLVCADRKSVV
jgi:hypothetical protein